MKRPTRQDPGGPPAGRRRIPSVDAVLRRDDIQPLLEAHGRPMVTAAIREALEALRAAAASGRGAAPAEDGNLPRLVQDALRRRTVSGFRRVINATGVVVHTNLGRAVLSERARSRVVLAASSYCSLEYDLDQGRRGSRTRHLERGLSTLFPGSAGLAVNNNAAAIFLALHTLARGREVVVSRGELVEIGGSFRIPEVMASSGARLREVGTTNKTRTSDYESAIGPETALILKVHRSNFRIVGFTEEAATADLARLSKGRGVPLVVDQGSGNMLDLEPLGIQDEPAVGRLLDDGADLVTFSGDKLLGGPQAGLAVGRPEIVERLRESPLYRALRLDKMSIAALEATLDAYVLGSARDELPVAGMILADPEAIGARAGRIADALRGALAGRGEVSTRGGTSRVGGGAAPMQDLPTTLVEVRPAAADGAVARWEEALRSGDPPVVARIQEGAILLDPRTVRPDEEEDLLRAVAACR